MKIVTLSTIFVLTCLFVLGTSVKAEARHHHSRSAFSINFGSFCGPQYVETYRPAYYEPVYVVPAAPVVYSRPAPVVYSPEPVVVYPRPAPVVYREVTTYRPAYSSQASFGWSFRR